MADKLFTQYLPILLSVIHCVSPQGNFVDSVLGSYRDVFNLPENLPEDTKKFQKSYDFVIVGAGSGGSALANRLSEVPQWSVLLLEAGRDEIVLTDVPLASTYFVFTDFNWGYKTEPQTDVCQGMYEKRCSWPRGKCVGGTSVINYMLYTRGHKRDYQEWEEMGNYGWGYNDVLPYFKKLENTRVPELRNSTIRGTNGPVAISHVPWRTPVSKAFLDAGRQMGFEINDPNGEKQIGFSYVQATMKNGRRFSASKAYLRPARKRPNLHVSKLTRVTKILIDPVTKQTFGVEFVKNRRTYVVQASKEVVLSAGAMNSPQLLMLSGVGPRQHLEDLQIPLIQDLPVGENLQDHVAYSGLVFLVNDSVTIVDYKVSSNPANTFNYLLRNTGPLTVPGGAEAFAFAKLDGSDPRLSTNDDLADIELVLAAGALSGDTSGILRRSFGITEELFRDVYGSVSGREGFSIVPVLLKPKSRGYMRLKSRNPYHWPLFYPGYYNDRRDMDLIIKGIRLAIRTAEQAPFKKFGTKLHLGLFPACRGLEYDSDAYWECAARQLTTNLQHQVGTCKMGPVDHPETVVDPELRVKGVGGLRVADASIMPTLPSAHTNAPVFMIGEKAADLIKRTWL